MCGCKVQFLRASEVRSATNSCNNIDANIKVIGLEHIKKLPIDVSTFTPPTVEKYIADPPRAFSLSKVVPVPHRKSMATIYHNPFSFADFRKPSTKMTVTVVENKPNARDPTSASAPASPKDSPPTSPFSQFPRRNSISTETPMLEHRVELLTRLDLLREGQQGVKTNAPRTMESNVNTPTIVVPNLPLVKEPAPTVDTKKKKSRLSPRKSAKPKHTRSKSESNWELTKTKPIDSKM